ncbi:MAG: flagellar protein FlaG [Candidatus Kapaibacteriales bacterium]
MINPIEGTPINELSTSLPDFRTNVVIRTVGIGPTEKQQQTSQGLSNFNSFLKEVEQNQKKLSDKPVDYDKISKKLEEIINDPNLTIQFTRDDITKKMIFKLINSETREVVQQIPPEVALKIARYIASTLENQNVANAKV